MKKIIFTALTIGSSLASITQQEDKQGWDEPPSHSLVGQKAEDVYYFDDIGNLLGHFGEDKSAEHIRHIAGMDIDTEVPAAKIQSKLYGDFSKDKEDDEEPQVETITKKKHHKKTIEEKVAEVGVTESEKFKIQAIKAAKEAAISKKVANRAKKTAHEFQEEALEAKNIAAKAVSEKTQTEKQINELKAEKNAVIKQAKKALKDKIKELEKQEDKPDVSEKKNETETEDKKDETPAPSTQEVRKETLKKIEKKVREKETKKDKKEEADKNSSDAKIDDKNNTDSSKNDTSTDTKNETSTDTKNETSTDTKNETSTDTKNATDSNKTDCDQNITSDKENTTSESNKTDSNSSSTPSKKQKVTVNIHVNVANATKSNQTAPAPAPAPAPVNDTTEEEEPPCDCNNTLEDEERKAKTEYINSKLSVNRSHPEVPITVHVMPYSYTMGQQYQNDQHQDQITQILNSVFTELISTNVSRTFSFMDVDSFQRWYAKQDGAVKSQMKELIAQGRFDFAVSAGQASSLETYGVLIESLTAGNRFLREEFGMVPRAAWQVNSDENSLEAHKEQQAASLKSQSLSQQISFQQRNSTRSHPSAYARLFSDMGFEGLLIDQPPNDIDLEGNSFLWRTSANHFQNQKQIFTSVISTTDHGYCWPSGFATDVKYDTTDLFDASIQGSNSTNAEDKMIQMINHINTLSKFSRGNQILIPFGCDYAFSNATLNYQQMDKLIHYFNQNNFNNIKMQYSTAAKYIASVNALRVNGTNINYQVKSGDLMPQVIDVAPAGKDNQTLLGLFDSTLLRQTTLARQSLRAASTLFSKRMISEEKSYTDNIIKIQTQVRTRVLETLDVLDFDESSEKKSQEARLSEAVDELNKLYQKELKIALKSYTGTGGEQSGELSFCSYSPTEGIQDCPISKVKDYKNKHGFNEFIVVVHNPSMQNQSLVRVKLESQDYKAKIWNRDQQRFEDTDTDIVEQVHLSNTNDTDMRSDKSIDYIMFVPFENSILGGEISFVKIEALNGDKQNSNPRYKNLVSQTTLEVAGISDQNEVMFHYTNIRYNMSQLFTVNLQTYGITNSTYSPRQFSDLNADVNFQQGSFVDQYTILFQDPIKKQFGVIKLRFSDYFEEILEFEVEAQDNSKENGEFTTISWRFLDGFETNKKFWIDSNGLEMSERTQTRLFGDNKNPLFFPVSSAIAIRDFSSLRQATILNDRPQLATADYQNSTVEFVHLSKQGQQMTSKYFLQIFDRFKGQSKQREQQILTQAYPLQQFYAFNTEESKLADVLAQNEEEGVVAKQNVVSLAGSEEPIQAEISYDLYAVGQNEVLLRIYNRADRFDDKRSIALEKSNNKGQQSFAQSDNIKYLNVQQLANALYFSSVNTTKLPNINIGEVDVTGLRSLEELTQSRLHWDEESKSKSPPTYPLFLNPQDKNGMQGVAVQPQAIRTFMIRYGDKAKYQPNVITHKQHDIIEVVPKVNEERNCTIKNETIAKDNKTEEKGTDEETTESSITDAIKSTKNTNVADAPDLTPLYKTSEPVDPVAAKKDAPTKIVVHIKANQKEKQKKESESLANKIKLPSISAVSQSDDNDEFQGSVFDFENKVEKSKQLIDDKLSGTDKIKLPSENEDDSLVQMHTRHGRHQKSTRYLINTV